MSDTSQDAPPPAYVVRADGDDVTIRHLGAGPARDLGFRAAGADTFVRHVSDEVEKAQVLAELRDAGFYFSRGREWSPAEVFEYLRDKELVTGEFMAISWTRPGVFVLDREV